MTQLSVVSASVRTVCICYPENVDFVEKDDDGGLDKHGVVDQGAKELEGLS